MAGKAYITRMPVGFSGGITRPQDLTTEPVTLDPAKVFGVYGLAGKYVSNKFVPLENGDDISLVVGFLVRPYPTQSQPDIAHLGVTSGIMGDNLKRGYFAVNVPSGQAASALKGAKVYVRVAAATAGSPLGSIVLTPDATATNTPELTLAKVMGPGDGNPGAGLGTVEIAYNI